MVAVPLMLIGYVADLVGSRHNHGSALLYAVSGLFTAVLCAIVLAFLILMRAGYRWARTVLASGGLATVVYVGMRLFSVDWPPVVAVICGVTGIVGSVLIAGGMFLLYRENSHGYFSR
jgi:peptidoglycan biosynthesis protein MviN/MurJ (putative lipid II flippase)